MTFCWWIVTFEYVREGRHKGVLGHDVGTHCVFTTEAQKAMDATAILPGFMRVCTVRGTWAPLESLLINYYPGA